MASLWLRTALHWVLADCTSGCRKTLSQLAAALDSGSRSASLCTMQYRCRGWPAVARKQLSGIQEEPIACVRLCDLS
jgi:hypothetical protein